MSHNDTVSQYLFPYGQILFHISLRYRFVYFRNLRKNLEPERYLTLTKYYEILEEHTRERTIKDQFQIKSPVDRGD